jgi:hypothetical protein
MFKSATSTSAIDTSKIIVSFTYSLNYGFYQLLPQFKIPSFILGAGSTKNSKHTIRLFLKNAYICFMKAKINITIEERLLQKIKVYAQKRKISVSGIVEDYFETLLLPVHKKKNILDMVAQLNPDPKVVQESYNKEPFYEDQRKKYGF